MITVCLERLSGEGLKTSLAVRRTDPSETKIKKVRLNFLFRNYCCQLDCNVALRAIIKMCAQDHTEK